MANNQVVSISHDNTKPCRKHGYQTPIMECEELLKELASLSGKKK